MCHPDSFPWSKCAHHPPSPWLATVCVLLLGLAVPGLTVPLLAQNCPADSTWITNPSLPTAVTGGANASNCNFHQFEWQSFLWMVAPSSGYPDLLNFESPDNFMPSYGLFVDANQTPTPWGEVPDVPAGACTGQEGRFMGQVVKTDPSFSDDVIQATGDPLVDQLGKIVYYEKTVNEVWYDLAVSCQLYTSGCYDVAEGIPSFDFPVGTIELKTAWKILTSTEASSGRFHVAQALVELFWYDGTDKKYKPSGLCQERILGLVGFHLVSRSELHPEMIWATFEQIDNAPDCSDQSASPPDGGSWSFYDTDCGSNCPPVNTDVAPRPTQVCRVHPWGAGDSTNVNDIASLNQNVHNLLPSGSVWRHYQLTGGIWTAQGTTSVGVLPPDTGGFGAVCAGNVPDTNEHGSLCAANTTLETFGQQTNCFDCHHNSSTTAGITISHLKPQNTNTGCGSGVLPAGCQASSPMPKAQLPEPVPAPVMQPSHGPRYGTAEPAPVSATGATGER